MLHVSKDPEEPEITLEEKISTEAIAYARQWIKKGNTELVFEDEKINKEYQELGSAILTMRFRRGGIIGPDKKYIDYFPDKRVYDELVRIDPNLDFYQFDFSLELYKKYQMGNCGELTALALDYIVQNNAYHNRNIKAERYKIKNGNHVFIVIGRRDGSDPNNPLDWGDQAYICDPWLKKTYKATDYLKYLSDYKYNHDEKKHHLIAIDKSIIIEPITELNSLEHASRNSSEYIESLMALCKIKVNLIKEALTKYIIDMKKIALDIAKNYDTDDQRYVIIENRIKQAEKILANLNQIDLITLDYKMSPDIDPYHFYKKKLEDVLTPCIDKALRLQHFSKEEMNILRKYKQPTKIGPKIALAINVLSMLKKDLQYERNQLIERESNPLYQPMTNLINGITNELAKLTAANGDEKKEEETFGGLKVYVKKIIGEVEDISNMMSMIGSEPKTLGKYLKAKQSLTAFLTQFEKLLFNPVPGINQSLADFHNNLMKLKIEHVTKLLEKKDASSSAPSGVIIHSSVSKS